MYHPTARLAPDQGTKHHLESLVSLSSAAQPFSVECGYLDYVRPEYDDVDRASLRPPDKQVRIHALGVFRVFRGDVPVDAREWQSKKARDLLKILLSRRGRATTREEIIGLLWPDAPSKASNRLSVLLSTLRSVLSVPDGRDEAAVVADRYLVRLDLDVVAVDVEQFSELAGRAITLWHQRSPDALALLEVAEGTYGGDFCEEDSYEDWAAPVRDEMRGLYLSVVRGLTAAAREAGRVDQAICGLLTVLRNDPYDEPAHLELVGLLSAARRFGDARRRYAIYVQRMHEISVRPIAFPAAT